MSRAAAGIPVTPSELASSGSLVCEHLAISGYAAAQDPAFLEKGDVSHILKLYAEETAYRRVAGKHYKVVDMRDSVDFDLRKHLPSCLRFINSVPAGYRALVHCHMGVSRSSSVVMAHLMLSHRLSFKSAARLLLAAHPQAMPNPAFMEILKSLERPSPLGRQ